MAITGIGVDTAHVDLVDATDEQLVEAAEAVKQEQWRRVNEVRSLETIAAVEAFRDTLTDLSAYLASESITIEVLADDVNGAWCKLIFPVTSASVQANPVAVVVWANIAVLFDESAKTPNVTKIENPDVPNLYDRVRCCRNDAITIITRVEEALIQAGVIVPA